MHQASAITSRAVVLASQPAAATPGRIVQTYAGTDFTFQSDGQPAVNAPFGQPEEIAVDSAGTIYLVDFFNQAYRVTPDGNVHILAGNGFRSCC